eukprot:2435963-Prymnesium_polylepis.1
MARRCTCSAACVHAVCRATDGAWDDPHVPGGPRRSHRTDVSTRIVNIDSSMSHRPSYRIFEQNAKGGY